MTLYKQNFRIILTYLIVLVLPSACAQLFKLTPQIFLLTTIFDLLGALGLLVFNRRRTANSLEYHPAPLKTIIMWGISGILLTLLVQVLAGIVDHLIFKNSANSLNTITLMTAMRQQPWLILAVTIAAPVMEEIVFRGAIFGGLSGTINPLWAALISSLLFSLLHQDGHLIIYAAIGLFLCWLYRKTGSLYTTIISHAGMNLLVTLTYLLR
ncbi:CPBP family intramembrane glutamic endopeptidase [Latilactobacillus fuchuensis]|uniref:CAAX prenyl protease 2/Lysostaphin resistance protein A-like domain-containing protein n=2 Tax=Latilactobacillus fuchuensis TaxID=164393 RepID=A0A2N9DTS5_9LACO|nr:type II CAAX endopeptidase family protein [Latilactobacillus fuchuensis]KRL58353.1 CAAX amino terminal protease family protein [Latilactobacillus fuchuensis DSM 14340 = JCM 11249]MCP8857775.1 CPBP family intramembrane metalloprotease [Latilactobacillus fuchuensis]SPC36988.1 conserved membrane hypothetical protein [Latilactobacillus fuchuensis]